MDSEAVQGSFVIHSKVILESFFKFVFLFYLKKCNEKELSVSDL